MCESAVVMSTVTDWGSSEQRLEKIRVHGPLDRLNIPVVGKGQGQVINPVYVMVLKVQSALLIQVNFKQGTEPDCIISYKSYISYITIMYCVDVVRLLSRVTFQCPWIKQFSVYLDTYWRNAHLYFMWSSWKTVWSKLLFFLCSCYLEFIIEYGLEVRGTHFKTFVILCVVLNTWYNLCIKL